MYVGKAGSLRQRVWPNHGSRGARFTSSALRRNVAEHLNIATAADIKSRRYQPTATELSAIRTWIDGCDIAWLECVEEPTAGRVENVLKSEHRRPPLTKR